MRPSTNVIVSCTLPVGSSLPVLEPPGSKKYNVIRAPVPGTPSMAKSPSIIGLPSRTGTCASITLFVFVLKMRTTVSGSTAFTKPSIMANTPAPAEILPQLPS